ncbi:transcriptional regulator [Pontimicrobium sp. SW4]|uniref:Transcriptional regulator n=1 Tax=Pontimicrobium sp. SW4 TaxID=3153519 RepID=A0AAU7BVP6_9FLAO
MTSVITGDIIRSTKHVNPNIWLNSLKGALSMLESKSNKWEIYRGDSFQIEITNPNNSFIDAIYIKACIKMIKNLDVRLAIGIGDKTYQGKKVSESNGEAFVFSGETLENLKKDKQNLRIKTINNKIDEELNLYFKLALTFMDSWTVNSAEIVKLSIENPDALQHELAAIIGTKQDAISKRQKRAGLEHILELDKMYRHKISQL